MDFILSLGGTLLLEGVVALFWKVRGRDLLLFLLVNILTNPAVVLLHKMIPGWEAVVLLELGAVVIEGGCYAWLGENVRMPWRFALTANLVSFLTGIGVALL